MWGFIHVWKRKCRLAQWGTVQEGRKEHLGESGKAHKVCQLVRRDGQVKRQVRASAWLCTVRRELGGASSDLWGTDRKKEHMS